MPILKKSSVLRQRGIAILKKHIINKNLYRHCLSVEAAMENLARHFNADQETWGLAGLLHDADWEETKDAPSLHTRKTVEWLRDAGIDNQEVITTILSHNHAHTGAASPQNVREWSLYIADDLTGLIAATAFIAPDKRLASVSVEAILRKFGSRSFAAGVNREHIALCSTKLQISLHDFIALVLRAMQNIASELGL